MTPKTEAEILQLYNRIKPYFKVPKETTAKYGSLKRILISAGLPLNMKDRKERENLMLNEIARFVNPGIEYMPDEEILEATVDISKLFGGNKYLSSSLRVIEGYIDDIFIKQGFINMSSLYRNDRGLADINRRNGNVTGYFIFMPFCKDFNGWLTVEDIKSMNMFDKISGMFHKVNKALFDDQDFYHRYELTYDDKDTASLVLDDEVRASIRAFSEIYPNACFSFSRSYLFIFIQLTAVPIYYRYGDLQLLQRYVRLVEAGPMAVEIFKLNR